MKKLLLFTFLLSLGSSVCWAGEATNTPVMKSASVQKAPAIYSNTLIDKAPAGEVVNGIRDSYSVYFSGGISYRQFESGVVGEYVIASDSNVYLRAVDYEAAKISANTNTYLKLEPVDDTTYVAHTPQLIWVDNLDEDTPFVSYATRLGFQKKSSTSFSYEVETDENGKYVTDVFFTLKDGVLKQNNQETINMNGELFPKELIGFTSASGNWIGFGGGCITIYQPTSQPTTLPADAQVVDKTLDFDILHVSDKVINNAVRIKYAQVGNEVYISNPSAGTEQWVKGTIDADNNTVTFQPQYLGVDSINGYAVWFTPATYDKKLNVFDEETGHGDWFRTYAHAEKCVFKMENGKLIPTEANQALYFSHSATELLETGVYCDPTITFYSDEMQTPAPVVVTKFEPYDDIFCFGVVGFAIPCRSTDGSYIDPSELYFNFYVNDSTTPYLFSSATYIDMTGEMTNVPYNYVEDFDFKVKGVNHTVYFYGEWTKIGIQVLQIRAGEIKRSEIVYARGNSSVNGVIADQQKSGVRKYVKDGQIRIVRDGVEYNILGVPVK